MRVGVVQTAIVTQKLHVVEEGRAQMERALVSLSSKGRDANFVTIYA